MTYNIHITEDATNALARSIEYAAFVFKEPFAANEMMLTFYGFVTRASEVPESYPLCRERRLVNLHPCLQSPYQKVRYSLPGKRQHRECHRVFH